MLTDPAAPDEPELLTPGQTAVLLGVTRQTVYRWISAGELPAMRTHNGPRAPIRISRAELWRTLRAHCPQAGREST